MIMVIQDDDSVRSVLTNLLRSEGHRVVAFRDGGEGIAYLSTGDLPDLILVDLTLQTVDGRKFRAEQMMNPVLASIPVIVRKPFEARALLSKIRRRWASAETTLGDPDRCRRTA